VCAIAAGVGEDAAIEKSLGADGKPLSPIVEFVMMALIMLLILRLVLKV